MDEKSTGKLAIIWIMDQLKEGSVGEKKEERK